MEPTDVLALGGVPKSPESGACVSSGVLGRDGVLGCDSGERSSSSMRASSMLVGRDFFLSLRRSRWTGGLAGSPANLLAEEAIGPPEKVDFKPVVELKE